MEYIIKKLSAICIILVVLANTTEIFSQSYSLDQPVEVPIFQGYAPSGINYRDYFWNVTEINGTRLDLVVGLNQITNATQYNYVNGNWYKNQNDENFNTENTNTRFIYQDGYQYIDPLNYLRTITGLVLAKINSTSGYKDIIVSRDDSVFVFQNANSSITTMHVQRFFFDEGIVHSSGKFTTDAVEDVLVHRNDSVFIFKGIGNSTLDSIPVFKMSGASGSNLKFEIAQISSWIEPDATVNATTSNRDEIIMRQGNSIIILINDNNNGISSSYAINNLTSVTEFAIGDINNNGFNDLLTCSITQGIKIFLNNGTFIDTVADYINSVQSQTQSIYYADFDKDGWNDIIVNTFDSLKIFLNNHSSSMFSQTRSYSIPVSQGLLIDLWNPRMTIADLHNKGGLSIIQSGFPAVNFEAPPYFTEVMYRYNPVTIDAVPAPPLLFKDLVLVGQHYRPRLLLFNRGDRDFQKYIIYKKSPNFNNNNWFLLDSSNTSGDYIDYDEAFNEGSGGPRPPDNLFYYVKAQDNSYQVSINSDTIGYPTIVCPGCGWEVEGRTPATNISDSEIPKNYKITNYPNPFNPVTKITFDIPNEGNVRITIFNTAGQKIAELINEYKTAGSYQVDFNGNNLASGIYYYRIESGSFSQVRKMMLLK